MFLTSLFEKQFCNGIIGHNVLFFLQLYNTTLCNTIIIYCNTTR